MGVGAGSGRTVAFVGFDDGEERAVDAAMPYLPNPGR